MRDSQVNVKRHQARLFDRALASRTPSGAAADPAAPKAGHMTAIAPSRSSRQRHLDPRGPSTHDILDGRQCQNFKATDRTTVVSILPTISYILPRSISR